ncbi:MAG: hypothetical protein C0473_01130 [Cyanobacteria bacterium DS3.002]|nr:hypothetical protein [Cyanobacteria bacterium DS3.002]
MSALRTYTPGAQASATKETDFDDPAIARNPKHFRYCVGEANIWLPDEQENMTQGPYVRMIVHEVSAKLDKLLSRSMNVFEWDKKPIYRVCAEHKNDLCFSLPLAERQDACCLICSKRAEWVY